MLSSSMEKLIYLLLDKCSQRVIFTFTTQQQQQQPSSWPAQRNAEKTFISKISLGGGSRFGWYKNRTRGSKFGTWYLNSGLNTITMNKFSALLVCALIATVASGNQPTSACQLQLSSSLLWRLPGYLRNWEVGGSLPVTVPICSALDEPMP